jgi:hypothetical protein
MQAKSKNSELNACYIGQAGMHQGRLAFNKTLLLLKLCVLIFKSFERFSLSTYYNIHIQAYNKKKIRNNHQTELTKQNRGIKLIYASRRSHGHGHKKR